MRKARGPEQKAERREVILAAGRRCFAAQGWGGLTMAGVAEAAGYAKGTLYLYFPTKEALFLALLGEEYAAWFEATASGLKRLRKPTADRVAAVIVGEVAARTMFRTLLVLMHQILEQNLPREQAEAFKRGLLQQFQDLAGLLAEVLEGLRPAQAGAFLLRTQALVVGIQAMAEPSPVLKEIMQGPEWAPLRVDFSAELSSALRDLLRGMTKGD